MGKSIKKEQREKNLRVLEEEEDTLSLADLSIIDHDQTDCEGWDEKYYDSKSTISSSSSISSDHEDVFEFISNYNNNNVVPPENILFCGKLIPYRNPTLSSKKPEKWWRSSSFSLSSSRKYLGYRPTSHEMELKDLNNRQNRTVGDNGVISDYNKYGRSSKGKGERILWSMIKVLSCTSGGASYHAQSAVKASIGCISLV